MDNEAVAWHAAYDRSKLWGLGQHWDEVRSGVPDRPDRPSVDVEAKEPGRVALAETTEEAGAGDVVVPSLANKGGTNEGGGEANAEEYLDEEVIVGQHLGYGSCHPPCGGPLHLAIHTHTWCFLQINPMKSKPSATNKWKRLISSITNISSINLSLFSFLEVTDP